MAAEAVTAQSILTSFLLNSTAFTTPSLAALRQQLPSQTSDTQLKQYHREILEHRNALRQSVADDIAAYRLLPKGYTKETRRAREVEDEEDAADEGAEEDLLGLEEAIARLEQEERQMEEHLSNLDSGIEGRKQELEAFADTLTSLDLPPHPPPPSLKRELETTLGSLEKDVKKYRGLVDQINERAA